MENAIYFFAQEVIALAASALRHEPGHAQALAAMRTAFDALAADDQAWCRETLDKLDKLDKPPKPAA